MPNRYATGDELITMRDGELAAELATPASESVIRPSRHPNVIAAVERVLFETFDQKRPEDMNADRLADLLDPKSLHHTLVIKTVPLLSDTKRARESAVRRKRAAKLARALHELLKDDGIPEAGRAFPIGEWADQADDERPLASYAATIRGLAQIDAFLSEHAKKLGEGPLFDPTPEQSENDLLVSGEIRRAFNACIGADLSAKVKRNALKDAVSDDRTPFGPFISFAMAVMKELGRPLSASSISGAITKANNVSDGKAARTRTAANKRRKPLIRPRYKQG